MAMLLVPGTTVTAMASPTGVPTTEGEVLPTPTTSPRRPGETRCLWCGRTITSGGTVGRRRRYCAQACRQRAYESRHALQRGELPPDAVVLSVDERDDLADRLYQMRCAAEDVATALREGAKPAELRPLVADMLDAARSAERIR
jgi:hypothetical protein